MQFAEDGTDAVVSACVWGVLMLALVMGITAALALHYMPTNPEEIRVIERNLTKDWMNDGP